MKPIGIKKGTIKCKFCNKDYSNALAAYNCGCNKNKKWNNPRSRKLKIKSPNHISNPQPPSKQFKAMVSQKKGEIQ